MRVPAVDAHLDQLRNRPVPYDVVRSGLALRVGQDVYPTSEVSELIVECLAAGPGAISKTSRVLDYGTGTGFLAIQAARLGAQVVAVDINPAAIECARFNADRHSVASAIDFRLGANFSTIHPGEKFTQIVTGLPWDNGTPATPLELSMYDPGFVMRWTLFRQVPRHLDDGGLIFLTYSESAESRNPLAQFAAGYRLERMVERIIKGEKHFVVAAKRDVT